MGQQPVSADLQSRAAAWLAQDPDEATRTELQALIDSGDETDLAMRFGGRLEFGTAGLRGALGAGPMRMNRVVVAQAGAGLAAYLLENDSTPSVVIGYDARHNSQIFARDTAEIMAGAGVRAHLLPRSLPTPVLAFAIRHLGVSAGVMITASHNPPQDNGYKVYLGDGSQIVPPADTEISTHIMAIGAVDELPRSDDYHRLGDEVAGAYIGAATALSAPSVRNLRIVYTPMHGVGRDTLIEVARRAGFDDIHVVAAQSDPDPDFPTVAFPNPEEPGAMDLALDLARKVGADIIVANDPDADRCAVGVHAGGAFRMLTGDETGAVLADYLLRTGTRGVFAESIVSSDLLRRQAAAYAQPYEQTLTGFKWIGKIDGLAFGYEEALGFAVAPHIARDKDGITAILRVLDLAHELKSTGQTLIDRLDEIAREHGLHATGQLAVRVDDPGVIAAAMEKLRHAPPEALAGIAVVSIDDLADGYHGLPPTDGIRLGLADGARIIVRPSGTEPKIKCYLEVVIPVEGDVAAARGEAAKQLDAIRSDLASALGL